MRDRQCGRTLSPVGPVERDSASCAFPGWCSQRASPKGRELATGRLRPVAKAFRSRACARCAPFGKVGARNGTDRVLCIDIALFSPRLAVLRKAWSVKRQVVRDRTPVICCESMRKTRSVPLRLRRSVETWAARRHAAFWSSRRIESAVPTRRGGVPEGTSVEIAALRDALRMGFAGRRRRDGRSGFDLAPAGMRGRLRLCVFRRARSRRSALVGIARRERLATFPLQRSRSADGSVTLRRRILRRSAAPPRGS